MSEPRRSETSPGDWPEISGPYLPGDIELLGRGENQPVIITPGSAEQRVSAQADGSNSVPAQSVSVLRYRRKIWPTVLAVIVVLAMLGAVLWTANRPTSSPGGNSTEVPPVPSWAPTPGTQGVPVVYGTNEGIWEILEETWDSSGVTLDIQLTATKGTLSFSFFGVDSNTVDRLTPIYLDSTTLSPGSLEAPEVVRGRIRFETPRVDVMVVLATKNGNQITALVVKS